MCHLPERQTCCGALDLHDGDIETAGQLAKINCSAFAEHGLDAIVTIASGCGSQLQEYKQSEFADKVVDISQFLSQSGCSLERATKTINGIGLSAYAMFVKKCHARRAGRIKTCATSARYYHQLYCLRLYNAVVQRVAIC